MKLFSTRQKRFQARTKRGWSQDGLWKAILMHPSFMRATFSRCLSFDCLWGEHLWAVSYLTSHCCDRHCYPGQLWRRWLVFPLQFISQRSQGGILRLESQQKPWRTAAFWLVLCGSLSLLLHPGPPVHVLLLPAGALPYQSPIKKMLTGHSEGGNPNWGCALFPGDCSLGQVDKKTTKVLKTN